ncbi:hypothetical protein GGH99_008459 [Coemansia sp. RSA 1285]|nr:hypothetical protein GGH99_008459 [Coemansia sp. RSA 1285]
MEDNAADASKEDIDEQREDLESTVNPIVSKLYGADAKGAAKDDDDEDDDDDDSDSEGTDSDDDDNGVDAEDSEQGGDGLDTANDGSDDDDDDDNGTYSNSNPANNPNASNARRRTRAQGRRSGSKALGSSEQKQLSYPRSELVADLVVEPHVPIRRVRWNSTGTLLSSSGDDGVARMWKMTVNGTWREVAAITAEKSSAEM